MGGRIERIQQKNQEGISSLLTIMNKINVFIPAAGFASRLGPVSAHIPKPLLPVLGRTVLDMLLEKICTTLPVAWIGINVHHRWESVRDHAAASPYSSKIVVFHEKQLLGTGGALKNAASLLSASPFLVHNADILSGIDLGALLDHHNGSGNMATLAVHDYPEINTVWTDKTGRVKHVGKNPPGLRGGLRPVTYTGVAIYSPEFLGLLKEGRSEVVDAWLSAGSSGPAVGTVDVSGAAWSDIGTPDAYSSAVFQVLREGGEMSYVHPSVQCDRLTVGERTVIEGGIIFEGPASFRNCIILPGARVRHGEYIEDAIAGPGFRVPISRPCATRVPQAVPLVSAFMGVPPEKISFIPIGTGGSDRKYYRVAGHGRTAVLLECPRTDPDYQRQIVYSRFFASHSVPVARLLAGEPETADRPACRDNEQFHALFEDLGDTSLYSLNKCAGDPERVESLYRKTLDILLILHTVATDNARDCPPPNFRIFDYDHLRWETDYFIRQFVRATRGVVPHDKALLEEEFDRLARKLDSAPRTVVHRDFQSQNIMVTGGDTPRLIDYQGARMGPPAYDLASLLWDPYVMLDDAVRQRLMLYYLDKRGRYSGDLFDEASFMATVLPCRLQRHMQALGAYGFLAGKKGKKYFLRHVPRALSYLREEAESARSEYPALYDLVKKL